MLLCSVHRCTATTGRRDNDMKTTIRLLATGLLALGALSACGGGSGLSSDAKAAAAKVVKESAAEGVKLDKACVEKVAKKLSPEDAKTLADAADGDDPQLSTEGEALSGELFACADHDDIVKMLVEQSGMPDSAKDCLTDAFKDLDMSKIVTAMNSDSSEPPAEFVQAITKCAAG